MSARQHIFRGEVSPRSPFMARTGVRRRLLLVRHGQSAWNARNLFTGRRDPGLTEQGLAEAGTAGRILARRGIVPDELHTSVLRRAMQTAAVMLAEMDCGDLPTFRSEALNERDYGALTGMDKDEARKRWGAEQVHLWRRSWDIAPPDGESLRDTLERVRPYHEQRILPRVLAGRSLLIVAHGNSLRALVAFLEHLDETAIQNTEIATGEVLLYDLRPDGALEDKVRLLEQETDNENGIG